MSEIKEDVGGCFETLFCAREQRRERTRRKNGEREERRSVRGSRRESRTMKMFGRGRGSDGESGHDEDVGVGRRREDTSEGREEDGGKGNVLESLSSSAIR